MCISYLFHVDGNRVILNKEYSSIGYCYPRIFIESKDTGAHVNCDLTLCMSFNQSLEDFESWLDGTEIIDADIREVCEDIGINYDLMIAVIQKMIESI